MGNLTKREWKKNEAKSMQKCTHDGSLDGLSHVGLVVMSIIKG